MNGSRHPGGGGVLEYGPATVVVFIYSLFFAHEHSFIRHHVDPYLVLVS